MKKSLTKTSKTLEKDAAKAIHAAADHQRLFTWNKWLAVAYAVQAVIILVISTVKTLPITASYLTADTLASETAEGAVLATASRHIFDLNVGLMIAAILLLAAFAHGIAASVHRKQYEAGLDRGIRTFRWIEAALSSGLILVLVATVSGVTDVSLLLAIFVLCAAANMIGLTIEQYQANAKERRNTGLLCKLGYTLGATPWIIIGFYLLGANLWGGGHVPVYAYWLFAVEGLVCAAMAAVLRLQHTKVAGKWAGTLYVERAHMLLGFAAKTVLAIILFLGVLRP
jgi:hypothetical protein